MKLIVGEFGSEGRRELGGMGGGGSLAHSCLGVFTEIRLCQTRGTLSM